MTNDIGLKRGPATLIGLAFAALILAACNAGAGAGNSSASASASASAASSGGGSLYQISLSHTSLGSVLTGADGKTLYLFTKDSGGKSACAGQCVSNWPPLTVPSGQTATAGTGVTGTLGTIARDDGSMQVTIAGHPLYRYAADKAAGDTNGEGVKDTWFAVKGSGDAVQAGASSSPAASSSAGSSLNYGY